MKALQNMRPYRILCACGYHGTLNLGCNDLSALVRSWCSQERARPARLPHFYGYFMLTGSQKFTLMKSVSESLAGRADITELETLSFAEIHSARPATTVETTIVRGGFPELHANPDIDQVAFYNSYLATYLERD